MQSSLVFFGEKVAFEFKSDDARVAYDVAVDVKIYFNYLRADEAFYTLRSASAPLCLLSETCHRRCVRNLRRGSSSRVSQS